MYNIFKFGGKNLKMNKIIKKSIVLAIMFVLILSFSIFVYANNTILKQTTVTFIDKHTVSFMSSKNSSPEEIFKKNNIVLLEDEELNTLEENNTLKITISKKNKDIKENKTLNTNNNIISSYNNENQKTEKIETTIVEIPFTTVTKNISKESVDEISKVITEGKNGKKEVTSRNTYVNDKLVDSVEISSKILEKPIDKIIQISNKSVSRSGSSVTRSNNRWNYTDQEIDLLCAITAQECSTSYEGALAVITTAMNRAASSKWKQYGKDPLSQYKGKNQFTYSIDGFYKRRLHGNYKSFVKQAVLDALNGKRNHSYLSFNAASTGRSGKIIGDNVYF